MGRKRNADAMQQDKHQSSGSETDQANEIDLRATRKKRFVGVRQRPSGRWVAEIKDTVQKIRVWLGTFDTAEEAARAYDEAACLLRGSNTRTNFWPSSSHPSTTSFSSPPPPPALPSKITNLLLQRLCTSRTAVDNNLLHHHQPQEMQLPRKGRQDSEQTTAAASTTTNFTDFFPEESLILPSIDQKGDDYDRFGIRDDQRGSAEFDFTSQSSDSQEINIGGLINFDFVDDLRTPAYYSPFEMAEIDQEDDYSSELSVQLGAEIKRMKYERKFSASLYAFHGIPECLKLKVDQAGEQLTMLQSACRKNRGIIEEEDGERSSMAVDQMVSSSSDAPANDGESTLWSSLDLPSICFVQ